MLSTDFLVLQRLCWTLMQCLFLCFLNRYTPSLAIEGFGTNSVESWETCLSLPKAAETYWFSQVLFAVFRQNYSFTKKAIVLLLKA